MIILGLAVKQNGKTGVNGRWREVVYVAKRKSGAAIILKKKARNRKKPGPVAVRIDGDAAGGMDLYPHDMWVCKEYICMVVHPYMH